MQYTMCIAMIGRHDIGTGRVPRPSSFPHNPHAPALLRVQAFTVAFQLLPYTFMTVRGKWLEHRIRMLNLRTTYVRRFMEDFIMLNTDRWLVPPPLAALLLHS